MRGVLWLAALTLAMPCAAQTGEKEVLLTITGPQLRSGGVSELAWDGGTLVIQGVFVEASGQLAAQYFAKPVGNTTLENWPEHSAASLQYWQAKSNRRSPTGLGSISVVSDSKLPMYGVGSLAQRMGDAVTMGGTITTHVITLHHLTLHERISAVAERKSDRWEISVMHLPADLRRE